MILKFRQRAKVKKLRAAIAGLGRRHGRKNKKNYWYNFIDFGYDVKVRPDLEKHPYRGTYLWDTFMVHHLLPLQGMRVLDIGCNVGLYALRMAEMGVKEVVGIDRNIRQAVFVRDWFARERGKDYSAVHFVETDVVSYDLTQLGSFDLACLFCVAYYIESIHTVMAQVSSMAPRVALQGNLTRLKRPEYMVHPHHVLAGIDGMVQLLKTHGYENIKVVAPQDQPKPLVIGTK